LREVLAKHGVTLSANAVTTAVSANAVQAAPAHLVSTVAAVGLTKTAGTAAAQMLLKETLRQLQLWFAVASGGGVVLTAAVILAVVWPREATTVTPGIAGTNIVFRTNRGRPGPEIAAGTANIRINLSDPVGQNFEVVYTHDGRSETVTGVLPREIEFQADAFTASIAVHGPGPFKYEVYRNGQLSGAGGGSNGSTNHIVNITSLAGGRGIRVDGHSGGAAARR
jgi:hypothetical protein